MQAKNFPSLQVEIHALVELGIEYVSANERVASYATKKSRLTAKTRHVS